MAEQDPEQLADALEHEAEQLERRSREVQEHVESARADWAHKRRDENVPGAPPPAPDEEDEAAAANEEHS